MPNIETIIEDWFQKHFGHITPGTPDYAIAIAAKNDLKASLAPAPDEHEPNTEN